MGKGVPPTPTAAPHFQLSPFPNFLSQKPGLGRHLRQLAALAHFSGGETKAQRVDPLPVREEFGTGPLAPSVQTPPHVLPCWTGALWWLQSSRHSFGWEAGQPEFKPQEMGTGSLSLSLMHGKSLGMCSVSGSQFQQQKLAISSQSQKARSGTGNPKPLINKVELLACQVSPEPGAVPSSLAGSAHADPCVISLSKIK